MNPIVLVLATQRLAQLVVDDELTRPIREAIDRWATDAPDLSLRDRVATLINCTACMSIWAGGGVLLASRYRWGRPLVRILAASGAALLIEAGRGKLER